MASSEISTTSPIIELIHADYRMQIAPDAGGSVLSFSHLGTDILRPASHYKNIRDDPRNTACYPCVPWFGRINQDFLYGNQSHTITPTLPVADHENPLHGYGWISPWHISEQSNHTILLELNYAPQPKQFPFPFLTTQKITLTDKGATITLMMSNTGKTPMPAGLGLHPFFNRTPNHYISFEANHVSGADANSLSATAYGAPAKLPAQHIDHSYSGFGGVAEITDGLRRIHIKSDASILHLYAPVEERFFCLEPITHLPGELGSTILAPGEQTSLSLRIGVIS